MKAKIGKILANMIRLSLKQVNKNLLAELEKDNTGLTEEFSHLYSHFQIGTFSESKPTDVRGHLSKITVRPEASVQSSVKVTYIVPLDSTCIKIEKEISIPVNADHSLTCKFESSSNPLYKQVKNLIAEFVKEESTIVEKRRQVSPKAIREHPQ